MTVDAQCSPRRSDERERIREAVEHGKRVYAELAEREPELGWGPDGPRPTFGAIDDYGEAAIGVAVERDGRLFIYGEPDDDHDVGPAADDAGARLR